MDWQAWTVWCWPAEEPRLERGKECSAGQWLSCYGRHPTVVHCMDTDPKQQPLDVLNCGPRIRLCLVCKQHPDPRRRVGRLRVLESLLHSEPRLRRDNLQMGCWWSQI